MLIFLSSMEEVRVRTIIGEKYDAVETRDVKEFID
jgi:hypothetical protein